ncbi:hypothetical protein [Microvirga pudoricolor]|uniref:hypothetical protein n=1 Tax=Microvirga pudoricolor TaxID=2778729 RepID=UPI0019513B8D|nr:hypothetical protein [Microvirga pudoricolor]MBM6593430.1 hypothetical protein [Microvirga pudoricolor]
MREERLRATADLRPNPPLSSWRGHSGRRYIVGVHALAENALLDVVDAVFLAVRRGPDGEARVIDVAAAGSTPSATARTRWMTRVQSLGANEVHVHRLADGDAERRAIVDDLRIDENQAC